MHGAMLKIQRERQVGSNRRLRNHAKCDTEEVKNEIVYIICCGMHHTTLAPGQSRAEPSKAKYSRGLQNKESPVVSNKMLAFHTQGSVELYDESVPSHTKK